MSMDSIGTVAIIVIVATSVLPFAAIALTLWMGGMNPPDAQDGTAPRA